MVKKRARSPTQKEDRRGRILEAAAGLFEASPSGLPSVAQIMTASGLAKGTFYLYFKTKEDVFFAILRQGFQSWFAAVFAAIEGEETISPEQWIDIYLGPLEGEGTFLRLLAMNQAVLETNIPTDSILAFKLELQKGAEVLGEALAESLDLTKEAGVAAALDLYTVILGAWQVSDVPTAVRPLRNQLPDYLFPDFIATAQRLMGHILAGLKS